MKRILAVAVACVLAAACTTTNVKKAPTGMIAPSAGAKVLVVEPDIQLSILTFSGLAEPRADWSKAARDNIQNEIDLALAGKSHPMRKLASGEGMDGKAGQLLRLHQAVGASIMLDQVVQMPTKKGSFNWTLGEGAQALAVRYDSDYALFVFGQGSYSSAGRVVASALIGGPTGYQQLFASLVDLKTGQIVWFNTAFAGPNDDMRTPTGAHGLVTALLKDIPL